MEGGRGGYLDYIIYFSGLGSKRDNVKQSYLLDIHSEIGTLFHILVHHSPNKGEFVLKFAVYIVYNIGTRMKGRGGREAIFATSPYTFGFLEANAVMLNHRFNRNKQRNRCIVSQSGPSRPEYRRDRSEICCIYSL